jgi:hypothetical protein
MISGSDRRSAWFLWIALAVGCAASTQGEPHTPPGTGGDGEEPGEPPVMTPTRDATAPGPRDASAADAPALALPPDASLVAPDAAASGSASDAAATASDGPSQPPAVGARVSLEETVAGRWTGTRRTITMDGGSRIFTAGFEAGKFGAGGNGHLIRLPLAPGREYVLEYRLRFDPGWDFSRGGKIPGLAGGNAPSGCQRSTDVGFTARQMWRENGRLIGYIYDMDQAGACGNAIATGFNFAVGQWYRVKQRIKLNTGSSRNGVLELWIDDRQVINRSNMGWMIEAPDRRIDRLFLDFFFGGSTADWSPRRNCSLSFSDLFVTKLAD